jgi:2-polyprenyl-3-methyl-5-hydroxy-6-metoxy-1,4-benzoquinol methylase
VIVVLPDSEGAERTLQSLTIHRQWIGAYHGDAEQGRFRDEVFDYVATVLAAPPDATILDAGCGNGIDSVGLARRQFRVVAVDFSEAILREAEGNIASSGLADRVSLRRENLVSLSFPDGSFDYVLCWGVLMHIPEVEKAISELTRVLKQEGILVISEANMWSLQAVLVRAAKRLLRRPGTTMVKTPAGMECWVATDSGPLLTRQANIEWVKKTLEERGLVIEKHVANEFTDWYAVTPYRFLKHCIRGCNRFWFRHVKIPRLAFSSLVIAQKPAA